MDPSAACGLRDRSSSNNSGSSSGKNRKGTVRIKPKQRSSNNSTKHASPSDENSLTSFPSLSPSLANSPENTTRRVLPAVRDDGDGAPNLSSGRPSSTALDDLFSPTSARDGRTALFDEDTPVRDVPGALHHMSNAHIEHMIARLGAVPLVKQMAQDLAQRDAQVTLLRRRAEERERLLKRMLRDCEVSNLDIEGRLKELELGRTSEARKASGKSLASESSMQSGTSIDEQIEDAFEDVFGGRESSNGRAEAAPGSKSASALTEASSHPLSGDEGKARNPNASTGWRGFFGGGQTTKTGPKRTQATRSESAQQRLSAIHTASQNNIKRKGLSSDLFRPPPQTDDESSVATASDTEHEPAQLRRVSTDNSRTESVKSSSTSVASWAIKLVGGGGTTQTNQQAKTAEHRKPALDQLTDRAGRNASQPAKSNAHQHLREGQTKTINARSASTALGPNGTIKRSVSDSRNSMSHMIVGSPNQASAVTTEEQGPTEMDTILPDETRPPTLAPQEHISDGTGLLTDRFGFIYDQNRRMRQSVKAKNGDRIETLENHRRSFTNPPKGDDAASVSSQHGADKRSASPAPNAPEQPPKRWQDYLKLSSISGGELLSHTPSAAPITDIVTGTGQNDIPEKATPKVSISQRGLDLTAKPEPSPTVISENAELNRPGEQAAPPVTAGDEQDSVRSLLDQLTEVHDALQREKTSRWNDFLKKIRTERARNGEIGTVVDRRSKHGGVPEASWTEGEVIGIAGLGNEGKVGRAKWTEFKNLVLGGIPVTYRAKIWAECSGASGLRMPGYYDELVGEKSLVEVDVVNQIKMDIGRTLTDNIFFRKGTGVQKLEEILMAYARRNIDVGYCQGMNMLAANLLLIMPTAEDAFWVLVSLIEYILPDKYYDHSLLASRADQTVLRQYVGSILPQLSAHLDSMSIELEALTFQWFLSVFTDCLSAEALFRVWDVVLCTQDGATFLFQVALALLKLNERSLLACDSPSQVYTYINGHMTDHAVSIDNLIRASDALKKVVKREDVTRRRTLVVAQELERIKEREAIRKGKSRAMTSPGAEGVSEAVEERAAAEDGTQDEPVVRRASVIPVVDAEQDEQAFDGELEFRSPMPVDEEVQWRG